MIKEKKLNINTLYIILFLEILLIILLSIKMVKRFFTIKKKVSLKIWWNRKDKRRLYIFLCLIVIWIFSATFYYAWHKIYPNSMIISNEITLTEQMNEFVKNHLKNQVYSEDDLKKIFEDIDKFGYDYKKRMYILMRKYLLRKSF